MQNSMAGYPICCNDRNFFFPDFRTESSLSRKWLSFVSPITAATFQPIFNYAPACWYPFCYSVPLPFIRWARLQLFCLSLRSLFSAYVGPPRTVALQSSLTGFLRFWRLLSLIKSSMCIFFWRILKWYVHYALIRISALIGQRQPTDVALRLHVVLCVFCSSKINESCTQEETVSVCKAYFASLMHHWKRSGKIIDFLQHVV